MESNIKRIITNPLLFTPGPTPTPESIRAAMATPTLHHRTPEFEAIFAKVARRLREMLGCKEVLMLASSGTGAMESCISSFATKKILNINSGKFGERFGNIARALGLSVEEIVTQWDSQVELDSIREMLEKHKDIEAISFQICESAGGLRLPYEQISRLVKEHNKHIFVIADGITAIGVERIDTTHIDALIGGSQKAFMLPPGLSFIGLSEYAISHIESNSRGYYFNLGHELKNQRKNTTAYTPATTIIAGLGAYFDILDSAKISFDDIYEYAKRLSSASRESLKAIGLHIYPKAPANCMSVASHERSGEIIKTLKQCYQVNIANGQDRLKDKIFRINHMGLVPLHEASFVLNAVELVLQKLGIREFSSEANRIFFQHIGA